MRRLRTGGSAVQRFRYALQSKLSRLSTKCTRQLSTEIQRGLINTATVLLIMKILPGSLTSLAIMYVATYRIVRVSLQFHIIIVMQLPLFSCTPQQL